MSCKRSRLSRLEILILKALPLAILLPCPAARGSQESETIIVESPGEARETAGSDEASFTLNVNVDLVELQVLATDPRGRRVTTLTLDDFEITEDGVPQRITLFRQNDVPVSVGLVIDNSRSMTRKKPRVDAAALSFIRHNNPEDETFLIHFDDTARLAQGFSRDPAPIREMLASITPYGQTALFDAVRLALETVEAGEYSKKAILVISDGADNASQSDFQDVLDQVRQSGATLYAVGLFTGPAASASDPGASEALAHARSVLTAMAEAGGGRAFFPDSPDEVEALTIQIAQEIRDQYTLGYVPTNFRRDGTWRSLRLNVRPEARGGQIRLNYRHGYYAPPD